MLHLSSFQKMKAEFEMVHNVMQQPHETNWINNSTSLVNNPLFPKPVSDLSQWVEHITKQLIDDMPEPAAIATTDAYFLPSSHSDVFVPRKAHRKSYFHNASSDRGDDYEWGNELQLHAENTNNNSRRGEAALTSVDHHGLTLITLLFECAVAISVGNPGEAHPMLMELTQMASPYGPSCAERVVAYFAKAMSSRVLNSWLGICSPLVNYRSIHCAFQVFNTVSPFIKFAHFTSNQAILEAFQHRDRVHIVDLDIMQGLQWPALFHILATRMEGPPHVRLTGFGTSPETLLETGKQLSNFARRLGLSFEFHPVTKKFGDHLNTSSMVQLRRGETVAVHWLQHSLYDATGPDWRTLKLIEELSPRIFTLVEQDTSHNGGSFLDRFVGALHYYSTVFDSLDAYLPSDNDNRHLVEHDLMFREISNVLAVAGPGRSGEEKLRQWRSEIIGGGGFAQVGMSGNSMAQAQLILNMFPAISNNGYNLVQLGDGSIRLGWKETGLYVASAWTCSRSSC